MAVTGQQTVPGLPNNTTTANDRHWYGTKRFSRRRRRLRNFPAFSCSCSSARKWSRTGVSSCRRHTNLVRGRTRIGAPSRWEYLPGAEWPRSSSKKSKSSIYFRRLSRAAEYPASQNHPGEFNGQTFDGDKPRMARRSRTDNLTVICDPSVKKTVLKKFITHSGKAHFDVTSVYRLVQ